MRNKLVVFALGLVIGISAEASVMGLFQQTESRTIEFSLDGKMVTLIVKGAQENSFLYLSRDLPNGAGNASRALESLQRGEDYVGQIAEWMPLSTTKPIKVGIYTDRQFMDFQSAITGRIVRLKLVGAKRTTSDVINNQLVQVYEADISSLLRPEENPSQVDFVAQKRESPGDTDDTLFAIPAENCARILPIRM